MFSIGKKTTKHDQYIEQLSARVRPRYDRLFKGVTFYSKRNRRIAEIDLVGQKGESWDIYEVKCSHRITKAKMQLNKIKKILPKDKVRKAFFFCGESGLLMSL